jgi:hypothetical protein
MENKTIGELNKKAWYRFIKALFIIALLIVLGIFNLIAFTTNGGVKQIDPSQTTIQCNLADKKTFTAQSINLYLESSDFANGQFNYKNFFEGYNEYKIKAIYKGCYPKTYTDNTDIYERQKAAEQVNKYGLVWDGNTYTVPQSVSVALGADYNDYIQKTKNLYGSAKMQYLDFSFDMFDITPVFTYNNFLWLFIIGNAIILLIFEAVRRVFYYIVLGRLNPEK